MAEATELRRETTAEPLFGSLAKFAMSSVGSKMVMAVTGIGLWLFITAHLAGNLTVYLGRDTFNSYGAALHHNPPLLWGMRLALLIGFPLHILTALRTVALNRAARPVDYAFANRSPARAAAKGMMLSGAVVLAFFLYHLAHFTWRVTGPQPAALLPSGDWDAYSMLVMGFQQPVIAGFYLLGQVLLAAHLSHGLYSMFQHLGLWGRRWTPWLKNASLVVGYGLCLGFASIPLAVLAGILKP
ncbi:MAG: succinate dehydrogenase cytochrome b subunit [Myxococcota bacterium]